jgi:hypothetical protein
LACFAPSRSSAPKALTIRIEEKISKASEEAFSFTASDSYQILFMNGIANPYAIRTIGTDAVATSVRSGLLMNATIYSPRVKAVAWIARQNCCEMPDSMMFELVVSRVEIAPGEISSTVLTDCLKMAERYAILSRADILTPLIRTESLKSVSNLQTNFENLTMAMYDRTNLAHPNAIK